MNKMKPMTEKFFGPLTIDQANMIPFILKQMELFGITRQELGDMYAEFIEVRKQELREQAEKIDFQIRESIAVEKKPKTARVTCEKCGASIHRRKVNVSKCTMVGGGYKTADQCTNRKCRYTKYNK